MTSPKQIAEPVQAWSKRIYRCQKQSTIGRKEEGEGRSSRKRDHLTFGGSVNEQIFKDFVATMRIPSEEFLSD